MKLIMKKKRLTQSNAQQQCAHTTRAVGIAPCLMTSDNKRDIILSYQCSNRADANQSCLISCHSFDQIRMDNKQYRAFQRV